MLADHASQVARGVGRTFKLIGLEREESFGLVARVYVSTDGEVVAEEVDHRTLSALGDQRDEERDHVLGLLPAGVEDSAADAVLLLIEHVDGGIDEYTIAVYGVRRGQLVQEKAVFGQLGEVILVSKGQHILGHHQIARSDSICQIYIQWYLARCHVACT